MEINERVRTFVRQNLTLFADEPVFTDDDDIFRLGFVNSLFAMKLILFIEETFHCRVENHEMEIANFNSINNITKFIAQKQEE